MASEWIPVAVAVVTAIGSGAAAWLTGRAGARRALEARATKVTGLERQLGELHDIVEREDAEGTAGDVCHLRSDFERHLADESSRRDRASCARASTSPRQSRPAARPSASCTARHRRPDLPREERRSPPGGRRFRRLWRRAHASLPQGPR
jgi:hypothetical protein